MAIIHLKISKKITSKTLPIQTVGNQYEAARWEVEKTIEKVLPFESAGIWIDVGFGDGSLLRTVKEFGFTPVGFDVRSDNVNSIREFGIEAYCVDISTVEIKASPCRVVSMQYVLAAVPFPRRALQAAHALLGESGTIIVSTPNTESSAWDEMQKKKNNCYWGDTEIYHNFSKTSLYKLLSDAGFHPVKYSIGSRYRACMEVIARKV